MKRIINGKKYDTETAKEWVCLDYEALYQKRTGEFFLEEWEHGAHIFPLTEDEAKEWAENHLNGDTYEEIFGPVAE